MHYADKSTGNAPGRDSAMPVDDGQGDLFAQVQEPKAPAPATTTDLFLEFHAANPHVYLALRDLAREWRREGKAKCGMGLLYNTARWRLSLRTEGEGMFELNDHYQAFYARALMRFEPDLAGLFNLRAAPEADRWIASLGKAAA